MPPMIPQDLLGDEVDNTCDRWYETATLRHHTRKGIRNILLRVGRWLATLHPDIIEPQQWTRALAAEAVAAVLRLRVGDWVLTTQPVQHMGKEMTAPTKAAYIYALRTFFRDVQAWEWIKPHFDPLRCFATPRTVLRGIGPNPRIIADDMWAKLLAAGMNLTSADLPGSAPGRTGRPQQYPLEMVRAVALVWLFTGLRSDEIRRLRLGCVRWQPSGTPSPESGACPPQDAICLLDVPVNKTSPAFTKPVDRYAGLAIAAWEQVRPVQLPYVDPKTNEQVHMLFSYRNRPIGAPYVNATIIPMLCRKAGVPEADARGRITSHRARSTIASQLYNAAEPLTLEELQAWLGHRSPHATQHYAKITPTKLAKSLADAGYFERNVRTIAVLIDQQAVLNGDPAAGLPWKYYDLGHGYCTYDFFEQCEHRMACAQCAFYRPKDAFRALLLEKKAHLLHMKQDIPLTDLERAVVEGDLTATDKLIAQLIDVATPAGHTPRQLAQAQGEERSGDE